MTFDSSIQLQAYYDTTLAKCKDTRNQLLDKAYYLVNHFFPRKTRYKTVCHSIA